MKKEKFEHKYILNRYIYFVLYKLTWKAFHIMNPSRGNMKETLGFNTTKQAPKLKKSNG